MVAKDKDEEEEEEEPVWITKFEKEKTVPRNFYLGLRLKRIGLDMEYGTDYLLVGSILINIILFIYWF